MEELESLSMKSRKEAFVTGHGGSNHPWEVLWVCSSLLWGCWLFAEWRLLQTKRQTKEPSLLRQLIVEISIISFPTILSQTNYLYPYATWIMLAQILASGILSYRRLQTPSNSSSQSQPSTNESSNHNQLLYLTFYRSSIYVLTFCAILAVDFPLFPRRFCKTEVSGYGLMDVGAASFVISSGIVSGKSYTKTNNNSPISWKRLLVRPLFKAAPLILIGIVRIITNKELEYQEHVSEYGVHWNFFFTLGVLAIVPNIRKLLLLQLSDANSSNMLQRWVLWSPFFAMLLYQYELFATRNDPFGLEKFILTAPRVPYLDACDQPNSTSIATVQTKLSCLWMKFLYANREGILGCIGYCFLHAAGEWIGHHYVFGKSSTNANSVWPLARLTLGCWAALYSMNAVFHWTVSRRVTNLPFCLWALAHNLTILWGFRLLTQLTASSSNKTAILAPAFRAVNKHGLASFLIANLLTGLVNLMVPTIDQHDGVAMAVLLVYLSLVGAAALLLDKLLKKQTQPSDDKVEPTKKTN